MEEKDRFFFIEILRRPTPQNRAPCVLPHEEATGYNLYFSTLWP